eukprot:13776733-Ditylum_brightwellii.AAC.1
MQAPAHAKNLQKPVLAMRNASQKQLRKPAQLVRATSRDEGSIKLNAKQEKRLTMTGDNILNNIIPMAKDVTIAREGVA